MANQNTPDYEARKRGFYNELKSYYKALEPYESFSKKLDDNDTRRRIFDNINKDEFDMGEYSDFEQYIGYNLTPVAADAAGQQGADAQGGGAADEAGGQKPVQGNSAVPTKPDNTPASNGGNSANNAIAQRGDSSTSGTSAAGVAGKQGANGTTAWTMQDVPAWQNGNSAGNGAQNVEMPTNYVEELTEEQKAYIDRQNEIRTDYTSRSIADRERKAEEARRQEAARPKTLDDVIGAMNDEYAAENDTLTRQNDELTAAKDAFDAKYPEGWQPKNEAELKQYQKDAQAFNDSVDAFNANIAALEEKMNNDPRMRQINPLSARYANNGGWTYEDEAKLREMQEEARQEHAKTREDGEKTRIYQQYACRVTGISDPVEAVKAFEDYNAMQSAVAMEGVAKKMSSQYSEISKKELQSNYQDRRTFAFGAGSVSPNSAANARDMSMGVYASESGRYAMAAMLSEDAMRHIERYKTYDSQRGQGKVGNALSGISNTAVGFGQKITDLSTWDFGITDLQQAMMISQAAEKFQNGDELTDGEKAILDAAAMNMAVKGSMDTGLGFTAGDVTAEAIPFIIQMFIAPEAQLGRSTGATVAKWALKKITKDGARMAGKWGLRGQKLIRGTITLTGQALANEVVGNMMALDPMQAATTAAGVVNRRIENIEGNVGEDGLYHADGVEMTDESMLASVLRGIEGQGEENASEFAGDTTLKYIGDVVWNLATSRMKNTKIGKTASDLYKRLNTSTIGRYVGRMSNSQYWKTMQRLREQAHFSGIIGETNEEIYGGLVKATLGIEGQVFSGYDEHGNWQTGVLSMDNYNETAMTMMPMQVMFGMIGMGGYGIQSGFASREKRGAIGQMDAAFYGGHQPFMDRIDSFREETFGAQLKEMLDDPELSMEQKTALLRYATATQFWRGAEAAIKADQSHDIYESVFGNSYRKGYEMEDVESRQVAYDTMLEDTEMFGSYSAFSDTFNDNREEYTDMINKGDYASVFETMTEDGCTELDRKRVERYITSKQVMEGINASRDDAYTEDSSRVSAYLNSISDQYDKITLVKTPSGEGGYIVVSGPEISQVKKEDGSIESFRNDALTVEGTSTYEDEFAKYLKQKEDEDDFEIEEIEGNLDYIPVGTDMSRFGIDGNISAIGENGEITIVGRNGETSTFESRDELQRSIRQNRRNNETFKQIMYARDKEDETLYPFAKYFDEEEQRAASVKNSQEMGSGMQNQQEQQTDESAGNASQSGNGAQAGVQQMSAEMQQLLAGEAVLYNDGQRDLWMHLGNGAATIGDVQYLVELATDEDFADVTSTMEMTIPQIEAMLHPVVEETPEQKAEREKAEKEAEEARKAAEEEAAKKAAEEEAARQKAEEEAAKQAEEKRAKDEKNVNELLDLGEKRPETAAKCVEKIDAVVGGGYTLTDVQSVRYDALKASVGNAGESGAIGAGGGAASGGAIGAGNGGASAQGETGGGTGGGTGGNAEGAGEGNAEGAGGEEAFEYTDGYEKMPKDKNGYRTGETFVDKDGNYITLAKYENVKNAIVWAHDKDGNVLGARIGNYSISEEEIERNVISGKWKHISPKTNSVTWDNHNKAVELSLEKLGLKEGEEQEDLVGKVGKAIKEKWSAAKKKVGNKKSETFSGKKYKGHYYLVEADALTPSHDPNNGFKPSEGFPTDENGKTINDRDYEHSKTEQDGVTAISTNYNGEALTHMPVVSPDGVPYSGNKRTMASQMAAKNGTDAEYIESLKDNLETYGFDEEELAEFEHPRVVFVLDEALPYDTPTFAIFNKQAEFAQSNADMMVKLGKILDDATFNAMMDAIASKETFGEVWKDENAVNTLIKALQRGGLLTQAEYARFVDGNEITDEGKKLIANALLGKVLEGRDEVVRALNDEVASTLLDAVTTALPQMAANKALGEEYSLMDEIADAIRLAYDARKNGVSSKMPITTHLRQQELEMPEDGEENAEKTEGNAQQNLDPIVITLGTFIHSNKTSALREFLVRYNKFGKENSNAAETTLSFDDLEEISTDERIRAYLKDAVTAIRDEIESKDKKNNSDKQFINTLNWLIKLLDGKTEENNGEQERSDESTDGRGKKESDKRPEEGKEGNTGGNGARGDENKELTVDEIKNAALPSDMEIMRASAIAYVNGSRNPLVVNAYNVIKNYVRTNNGQAARNSSDTSEAQLGAGNNESGAEGGTGLSGAQGEPMAEGDSGNGAEPGAGSASGENGEGIVGGAAGEGGNTAVGEGEPVPSDEPSDTTGRGGSGGNSGKRRNDTKRGGKAAGSGNAGKTGKRGTEARTGGNSVSESSLDDLLGDFNDLLGELSKSTKSNKLNGLLLPVTPEQSVILFKLTMAGAKVGLKLIQMGVHEFANWAKKMAEHLSKPIKSADKDVTDAEITAFIENMWSVPVENNGETHTLEEWAAKYGEEKAREVAKLALKDKAKAQEAAESIGVKVGDIDNIRATLPYLLPQQQDDVLKAETQFFNKKHSDREHGFGKGMMFTNGTGTGKTYTGLGIVKRFVKQGKGRVLIITPSQEKVLDWTNDAKNLGIEAKALADTKDKGDGVVITTFANFRDNYALQEDAFDLVIYDECQYIIENKDGKETKTARMHYMLTNRTVDDAIDRQLLQHPIWVEQRKLQERNDEINRKIRESNEANAIIKAGKWPNRSKIDVFGELKKAKGTAKAGRALTSEERAELQGKIIDAETQNYMVIEMNDNEDKINDLENLKENYKNNVKGSLKQKAEEDNKKTKTVFLSASPFNTVESLAYAEGYIYSYPEEGTAEANRAGGTKSQFMQEHFPNMNSNDAEKIEDDEIAFSDYLQNELGTMSGRMIDSEFDYSRDFPLTAIDHAKEFNDAVEELRNDKVLQQLSDSFDQLFDHAKSSALFETMKVSCVIPRIKEHLAAGRKVVIFHRRVESQEPPRPPFSSGIERAKEVHKNHPRVLARLAEFEQKYADLIAWEQTLDYRMPREQLASEFGKDNIVFFSGKETKGAKHEAVEEFNLDNEKETSATGKPLNRKQIIVVQERAGREGISLHDRSGKYQRVMINLALPESPITFLQTEGRTYRIGNKTNAIFEYPLLGIQLEQICFAQNINKRASTTENLALGSKARALRESITRGFLEHSGEVDVNNQGIGGKAYDKRAGGNKNSTYEDSVDDYNTDSGITMPEGEVSTPNPVGFKMVEWAGLEDKEAVLEPSAGYGNIARYVRRSNPVMMIEPNMQLQVRLNIFAGGSGRRVNPVLKTDTWDSTKNDYKTEEVKNFEQLKEQNKFASVIMTPPSGKELEHVQKATKHLEDGGRVVALVPADKAEEIISWVNGNGYLTMRGTVKMPKCMFAKDGVEKESVVVVFDMYETKTDQSVADQLEKKNYDFSNVETVTELFEKLRDADMPSRYINEKKKAHKICSSLAKQFEEKIKGVQKDKTFSSLYESGRYNGRRYTGWVQLYLKRSDIGGIYRHFTWPLEEVMNADEKLLERYKKYYDAATMSDEDFKKAVFDYPSRATDKDVESMRSAIEFYMNTIRKTTGLTEKEIIEKVAGAEEAALASKREEGKADGRSWKERHGDYATASAIAKEIKSDREKVARMEEDLKNPRNNDKKYTKEQIAYYNGRIEALRDMLTDTGATFTKMDLPAAQMSLDEISDVFKKLNTDEALGKLFDKVVEKLKGVNVKIGMSDSLPSNVLGEALGGMVRYNRSYINSDSASDQEKAHTLIHELVHLATVCTIASCKGERGMVGMPITRKMRDAVDTLTDIYNIISNTPEMYMYTRAKRGEYGATNIYEFVAELSSNVEFRRKLKSRDLWTRIVDAIKQILGFNVDGAEKSDALKEAEDALDVLLDSFDPVIYNNYSLLAGEEWGNESYSDNLEADNSQERLNNDNKKPLFEDLLVSLQGKKELNDKDYEEIIKQGTRAAETRSVYRKGIDRRGLYSPTQSFAEIIARRSNREGEKDIHKALEELAEASRRSNNFIELSEAISGMDRIYPDEGSWSENIVYLSENGDYVRKIWSVADAHKSLMEAMNRVAITNSFFPDAAMYISGVTEDNGEIKLIVDQRFCGNTSVSEKYPDSWEDEVANFVFEKYGLKKDNDNELSYYNELFTITDLHGENVVVDDYKGDLHIIDTYINVNPNADLTAYQEPQYSAGLHRGDLGKAEHYSQMMGGSRGTGHFGTGTYFLGMNPSPSNYMLKGERPAHSVDFSGYKLLTPKDFEDGYFIHEFLRKVNKFHEFRTKEDVDAQKIEKAYNDAQNFYKKWSKQYGDLTEEEREYVMSLASSVLDEEKIEYYKHLYDNEEEENFDRFDADWDLVYGIAHSIGEKRNNIQSTNKEEEEAYLSKVAELLNTDKENLLSIINDLYEEYGQLDRWSEDTWSRDSMSTSLMKKLGYEGVDVRGIKGLDNTTYGSVIYDVNPKSVRFKRKKGEMNLGSKEYDAFYGISGDLTREIGRIFDDVAEEFGGGVHSRGSMANGFNAHNIDEVLEGLTNPLTGDKAKALDIYKAQLQPMTAALNDFITRSKGLIRKMKDGEFKDLIQNFIDQAEYAKKFYKEMASGHDVLKEGWRRPTYRRSDGRFSVSTERPEIDKAIDDVAKALNAKVKVVKNYDGLPPYVRNAFENGRAVGYYDVKTGEVVLNGPYLKDEDDAKRTVLHEVLGHRGLRAVFGQEAYDKKMHELFRMLPADERMKVVRKAMMLKKENSSRASYRAYLAEAMDEYMAEAAEEYTPESISWFGKVMSMIREMLRKLGIEVQLTPDDVAYLLWKSGNALKQGKTPWDKALRDAKMQKKYGTGIYDVNRKEEDDDPDDQSPNGGGSRGIRFSKRSDEADRSPAGKFYEQWNKGFMASLDEAWHDMLRSLNGIQKAVTKQSGQKLKDFQNAYLHTMHLSSKNKAEIDKAMREMVEPMFDFVARFFKDHNTNKDEMEKYLISKHGKERNESFAMRDAERAMEDTAEDVALKKAEKDFAAVEKSGGQPGDPDWDAAYVALGQAQAAYDKERDAKYDWYRKHGGLGNGDYAGLTETFYEAGDDENIDVTVLEARAEQYMQDYEAKVGDEDRDELWEHVHKMSDFTLKKAYDSGMISRKTYDRVKSQFNWYVPLRGWEQETAGDVYDYLDDDVRREAVQQTVKNANGRKSRAGDILETMCSMAHSAILVGNKNLAKQALLRLAEGHPTPLMTVTKMWYVKKGNTWEMESMPEDATDAIFTGKAYYGKKFGDLTTEDRADFINTWEESMKAMRAEGKAHEGRDGLKLSRPATDAQMRQHQVRVRRNGKEYVVNINGNPRAAQAINGQLNADTKMSGLARLIAKGNRMISRAYTSLNPEFMLRNVQRDWISASNVSGIKYGSGYVKKFEKNMLTVLPMLAMARGGRYGSLKELEGWTGRASGIGSLYTKMRNGKLDTSKEIDRLFKEFIENGGETGYSQLWKVDRYEKELKDAVEKAKRGKVTSGSMKAIHALGTMVSRLNDVMENATRFAVYMTSRQSGKSILQSVNDAKEASTNFNKKGSGAMLNREFRNLFIFANAAIQGTMRYVDLLTGRDKLTNSDDVKKNLRKRALFSMGMTMAIGSAVTLYNYLMAAAFVGDGDDDDDKKGIEKTLLNPYLRVGDYKRRNNLLIYIGSDTDLLTINLSPEEAAMYGVGAILTERYLGYGNQKSFVSDVVSQISRVSPFGAVDIDRLMRSDMNSATSEMANVIAPTYAKIYIDALWTNRDFMGNPIANRTTYNEDDPEYTRVRRGTSSLETGASEWLYNTWGIDVNPNIADYIFKNNLGGIYSFPLKVGEYVSNLGGAISGDYQYSTEEYPMASVFFTPMGNDWQKERAAKSTFEWYKYDIDKVQMAMDDAKRKSKSKEGKETLLNRIKSDDRYVYWKKWQKYSANYDKYMRAHDYKRANKIRMKYLKDIEKMEAEKDKDEENTGD